MKRVHLIILIVAMVLMVLSGYSIAAMNLVHPIKFDWYSKISNDFDSRTRNTAFYQLSMTNSEIKPRFEVIIKDNAEQESLKRVRSILKPDFEKYVYIYASLGEVTRIDSNIKISEMAQRGNSVEVVASLNNTSDKQGNDVFYPEDIIRIERNKFIGKGKTHFVFKNQFGTRLSTITCDMRN